jgi:hypothetical protein
MLRKPIQTPQSQKIQWVKEKGNSFRLRDGRIIKRGQKFSATEEEVPLAFRDVIKPLEPLPSDNENIDTVTEFEIVQAGTQGGWFNIVNKGTGKVINSKGLRKEKALELIKELS